MCGVFDNEWCMLFLLNDFSESTERIIYFLFFVQLIKMNYIHCFLNFKQTLHSWDKSHLVVVYNPLYVLLVFIEDFYVYIHKRYWSVVFFFFPSSCNVFIWFWYQSNTVLIELVGKYFLLVLVFLGMS